MEVVVASNQARHDRIRVRKAGDAHETIPVFATKKNIVVSEVTQSISYMNRFFF